MSGAELKDTLHLYEYHVWANNRVLGHLQELPPETVNATAPSLFSSLFETIVHMYRVDTVWLYAMSGRAEQIIAKVGQITEETKGKSIEDMQALFRDLYEETRAFLTSQADAGTIREYRHPQYGSLKMMDADIVRHIVNHGTYHRGNLSAMLRQLGHTGVPTDYVFYMYEFPTVAE